MRYLWAGPLCAAALATAGCAGGLKETFGHNLASTVPATPATPASGAPSPSPSPSPSSAPSPSASASAAAGTPATTATPFTGALITPPATATAVPVPSASPYTATVTLADASLGGSFAFPAINGNYPFALRVPPASSGTGPVRIDFNANPIDGVPTIATIARSPRQIGGGLGIFAGYVTLTATQTAVAYVQSPEMWINYVPVNGALATVQPGFMGFYDGTAAKTGWTKAGNGYTESAIGNVYYPGNAATYTLQPNVPSAFAAYIVLY